METSLEYLYVDNLGLEGLSLYMCKQTFVEDKKR